MSASIVNRMMFRVRDQGLLGLLCAALIKVGVKIQKLGNKLEQRVYRGHSKFLAEQHRHFPGVLELIQKSYSTRGPAVVHAPVDRDVLCWIVPPFSKGSGGHTTIFRFISGLEKLGVKNKIYLLNDMPTILKADQVKKEICEFFSPIVGEVEILLPVDMKRDVGTLVCTSWQTAYAARAMKAQRKIYFMQDYEPFFSPVGSYFYFAEETYRMGFEFFTAGPWLLDKVAKNFEGKGDFFYLCPDRSIYFPKTEFSIPLLANISREEKKKAFYIGLYNRTHTPRRCVEIVWIALDILAERGHPIMVFTFGEDEKRTLPFPHKALGILNHQQLAEVYSFCDVVIAPSATNLSLLAREVMACAGIVIDLKGENTQYDLFHEKNALLCRPEVSSFVEEIESLITSPNRLSAIKSKISDDVKDLPNWDDQVAKMKSFLRMV